MPIDLSSLNPTQLKAVKTTEGPVLILAGAGSGKTRILTYRTAYLVNQGIPPDNILLCTFTNKASGEMKSRIRKLLYNKQKTINHEPVMGTFHSLCARILRKDGLFINLPSSFSIYDEGDAIDAIKQAMNNLNIPTQKNSPSLIKNTISGAKNEMLSALEYPRYAKGFFQETVARIYLEYQKILEQNKAVDFDDLLLLTVKLFQNCPDILSKYQIQFRYILIDEYQDTNAVQYLLSKLLANRHKNICVVGDASQCLLPGSKIATVFGEKEIEKIQEKELIIAAAGRGKTHLVPVTKVKISNYHGPIFIIKTKTGRILRATPNHITFARLNLNQSHYYVYLMFRQDKGYRIGLAKGARASKEGKLSIGLQIRSAQESADKMWILKVCKNRAEANYWEQWFIAQYGIPSMVFSTGGRSMLITQKQIDQLYQSIDTRTRANKIFEDYCLFEEYPHYYPKGIASRISPDRQIVHLTLFSDKRPSLQSPWCGHRVSINTSNYILEKQLKQLGHHARTGKRNTWRIETCHWNYEKALLMAEKIAHDGGGLTINHSAFIVDNNKFIFTPISHLRETMEIGILEKNQITTDEIVSAETIDYQGKVYDLDVDILHNYSADGIIVHNSIYSFRGADFRNIVNFQKDYPQAQVFNLEQNYRSTQTILDAAYAVISKNRSHPILKLWTDNALGEKIKIVANSSEADEAQFIIEQIKTFNLPLSEVAVLYRTNAQSRSLEEVFLRNGIPYVLVGGTRFYERREIKDLLAYLRLLVNPTDSVSTQRIDKIGKNRAARFYQLQADMQNNLTIHSTLELMNLILEKTAYLEYLDDGSEESKARIENVKELKSVAQEFPDLNQFLENVALVISEYSADEKLKQGKKEAVTLMTLHQAKGLEWPVVFIVGMEEGLFPHSRSLLQPEEMEEERRLCYVGITRAKKRLFLTYARRRLYFGTRSSNEISRFLRDLPVSLTENSAPTQPISPQFTANLKSHYVPDKDDWLKIDVDLNNNESSWKKY